MKLPDIPMTPFSLLNAKASAFLALLFLVLFISHSFAEERILKYHSLVKLNEDSTVEVSETITVVSENDQIKHGIYRDFPTKYDIKYASWLTAMTRRVAFDLVEVMRDNKPEDYHTEELSDGVRVYIGSKNVIIPPGKYTYTIKYRTDRQIGFFKDHDEIYWNVTGNGWQFPIGEASATVELPTEVPRDKTATDGYTGPMGSVDKNFKAWLDNTGRANFMTTAPLDKYEGLTVVVSWPKGFMHEPDREMEIRYFFRDAQMQIAAAIVLALVFLYYCIVWFIVGRDPRRGPTMPIYTPPAGLSPGAVRYLTRMGYDNKAFVSAVINMAVKGFLKIKESKGTYSLTKIEKPNKQAPDTSEEAAAYNILPEKLDIKSENSSKVNNLTSHFEDSLERKLSKQFSTNKKYMIPGIVASIAAIIIGLTAENNVTLQIILIVSLFMFFFCLVPLIFAVRAIVGTKKIIQRVVASVIAAVFAAGAGAAVYNLYESVKEDGFPVFFFAALFLLSIINFTFYRLLKARTPAGRKIMDEIEGFRLYLSAAEQDRLDRMNPPEKTPELFERYLPYALALDLEHRWAEQFAGVFPVTGDSEDSLPSWYSGTFMKEGSRLSVIEFASAIGNSLPAAVSSSSVSPGSSSGMSSSSSGGGSSGGGGGGGGGGGW